MLRIALVCCLMLLLPLLAWAQCKDCPGNDKEGGKCASSEFHRYQGDSMLSELTVTIKAESQCAEGFKLLLRDTRGRKITEIALTGPHTGEQTYNVKLDQAIRADAVRQGVLLNATSSNVSISYLKVMGTLSDGEFKFFEKECPGVVIGEKGCPRMVLFDGV